jgi:putative aldouronate transport system permease protein
MYMQIQKTPSHRLVRRSMLRRLLTSWQLYLCLLPAVVYLFLFNYMPMYGVIIAFKNYKPGLGIAGSSWVGLKHFQQFVNSVQFPVLMRNTFLLSVYSLLFGFPIPVLLALMLNEVKNLPFKKVVQNATYIPYFISTVVMVAMIINFTAVDTGVINTFIRWFGGSPLDFMGKSEYFRSLYVVSGIWQSMGWNSIIYIAALAGVDVQLYEAAQIDGASRMQRIWHVSLPGIAPTVIMLFILNCGSLLNVGYEKVYLMQNAMNIDVSEVISTYVYKVGLLGAKFSYTSAIGLFNTLINFLLLLAVNFISRRVSDVSLF